MKMKTSVKEWTASGSPWIWLNAGAVAISVIMVVGLLGFIAVKGLSHFWPGALMEADYVIEGQPAQRIIGEIVEIETVDANQIRDTGISIDADVDTVDRYLLKIGNRDLNGGDFRWALADQLKQQRYPKALIAVDRREWGVFYGYLTHVKQAGEVVAAIDTSVDENPSKTQAWALFEELINRAQNIHTKIYDVEKHQIGAINYDMERLRLDERAYELENALTPELKLSFDKEREVLNRDYEVLQTKLTELYGDWSRDSFVAIAMDGQETEINISKIVRASHPNNMNNIEKIGFYFDKIGEFLLDDPREANTEGGVFPAIFGTVLMVLLMTVMVTPFGVVAAVYLREYAKQGLVTQSIRIAVNNLAGVPSIVYGVFGLGFFIYFLGGEIDSLFFPEALPAPTFGTPGLLWASLTLALLTLPVVIVATEEGLSRIPRMVREGSLALGATKAETLWRVVLPMASPAMMTGVILAVARAAGEVAPLMLVGVVKLAPSLPLDGNYPYLHLDQKFMHLGFHIYDVGFQSPNVEAARPLVYATALLLVAVIALLNLSAVYIRNSLREKYKSLEM
jgi:phosphate transport system permease protein